MITRYNKFIVADVEVNFLAMQKIGRAIIPISSIKAVVDDGRKVFVRFNGEDNYMVIKHSIDEVIKALDGD